MLHLAAAILIQGVTLISPERTTADTDVLIRDGKIAKIAKHIAAGDDVRRIDGRGKYLIPGLIDSHTHPGSQGPLDEGALEKHPELLAAYRAQLPLSYLKFGFTTIVDLDLRPQTLPWFNSAPIHPTLLHCGPAVKVAGGYGARHPTKDTNLVDEKEHTPKLAVDRVVEAGGVCVKTFVEPGFGGAAHWPVPSAATLDALRDEAHKHGLLFIVHANGVGPWRAAIDAHADIIAHGLWHWPGPFTDATPPQSARDVIRAAAKAHIAVQPTLQALFGDLSIFDPAVLDDPRYARSVPPSVLAYLKSSEGEAARLAMADEYRQAIRGLMKTDDTMSVMSLAPKRAVETLRIMLADDVHLLFGSDTPSNEGIGNPPGFNGRLEISRWADAGVPLARILRAATIDNARMFKLNDRGTIEVGKRADVLLLRENPLKSVSAYDTIELVILNGEVVAPVEAGATSGANHL